LDVTGHDVPLVIVSSESFGKERLGDELLLFEIGIENHR
jgi:hypothetical protein